MNEDEIRTKDGKERANSGKTIGRKCRGYLTYLNGVFASDEIGVGIVSQPRTSLDLNRGENG